MRSRQAVSRDAEDDEDDSKIKDERGGEVVWMNIGGGLNKFILSVNILYVLNAIYP